MKHAVLELLLGSLGFKKRWFRREWVRHNPVGGSEHVYSRAGDTWEHIRGGECLVEGQGHVDLKNHLAFHQSLITRYRKGH